MCRSGICFNAIFGGAAVTVAIRQPPSCVVSAKLRAVLVEQRLSPPSAVRWSSWRINNTFLTFDLSLWELCVCFLPQPPGGVSARFSDQPFLCSFSFYLRPEGGTREFTLGVVLSTSALASMLTGSSLLIFFCGVSRPSPGGLSCWWNTLRPSCLCTELIWTPACRHSPPTPGTHSRSFSSSTAFCAVTVSGPCVFAKSVFP